MFLGSIERYSDKVLAVSVKKLKNFPALSYFVFCIKVQYWLLANAISCAITAI